MSNTLSNQLLAQIYAQESGDPFLTLLTLEHDSLATPIRLVNNIVDIESRGDTYSAFAFKTRLPADDGESKREVILELDNASLELIDELRSVDSPVSVKIELILASIPDTVQMSLENLEMSGISYSTKTIKATLRLDDFLNTALTSETYDPKTFPGLF